MAKLAKIGPSDGIRMRARMQFEARKPLLGEVLARMAHENDLEMDDSLRATILRRVLATVEIEPDTLRPIIKIEVPSDVALSIESEALNGGGKVERPRAYVFAAALRDAFNDQVNFDPIDVFPDAVLGTALLPEEASAINSVTRMTQRRYFTTA